MATHQPLAAALACAAALLLGPGGGSSSRADEQDYDSRVGVFVECLSIRNNALAPGTPVTIIGLNAEEENTVSGARNERRIAARIAGKTDSAEDCPLLIKEQGRRDDAADFTLYSVAPATGGAFNSVETGIAIIGLDPEDTEPIDLDRNGVADTFAVGRRFRLAQVLHLERCALPGQAALVWIL